MQMKESVLQYLYDVFFHPLNTFNKNQAYQGTRRFYWAPQGLEMLHLRMYLFKKTVFTLPSELTWLGTDDRKSLGKGYAGVIGCNFELFY